MNVVGKWYQHNAYSAWTNDQLLFIYRQGPHPGRKVRIDRHKQERETQWPIHWNYKKENNSKNWNINIRMVHSRDAAFLNETRTVEAKLDKVQLQRWRKRSPHRHNNNNGMRNLRFVLTQSPGIITRSRVKKNNVEI